MFKISSEDGVLLRHSKPHCHQGHLAPVWYNRDCSAIPITITINTNDNDNNLMAPQKSTRRARSALSFESLPLPLLLLLLVLLLSFQQESNNGGTVQAFSATQVPSPLFLQQSAHAAPSTSTQLFAVDNASSQSSPDSEVDIAIVGAGLGGLCAGAILNTLYNKRVGIYESHYLAGGCAHAFDRKASNGETFTFDSGPTILLGCSQQPFSALRQVLDAVDAPVEWIRYDGWGMIEHPTRSNELRWKCELGDDVFQKGPLTRFGGEGVLEEFEALRELTKGLVVGAGIPAMAMRPGNSALVPLLRYFPTLIELIQQGEALTGTFESYMDGPDFVVKDPWLRDWLDALAFSLSGLPASRTSAAAMAFVLDDMHRDGAALDYPKGGLGTVIDALVKAVESGANKSKLHLRQTVQSIDFDEQSKRAAGVTLASGQKIKAREGVICNAPVWSLRGLVHDADALSQLNDCLPVPSTVSTPPQTWSGSSNGKSQIKLQRTAVDDDHDADTKATEAESQSPTSSLLNDCDTAEMTGSFLHLHVAIDAKDLDVSKMEAHYTVMDRGLSGDKATASPSSSDGTANTVENDDSIPEYSYDGPCGELNMIAVSNPCVIDPTLAPEGYMVLHAYGAGNEPYHVWEGMKRNDPKYESLKQERADVLWRAMESVIPDIRQRVVLDLVGSPLTHERFLRRPRGTYGAATEDYLKDGKTPIENLILAGDSIFPGIGVPAVAISGASAANAFVSPIRQWQCLNQLNL